MNKRTIMIGAIGGMMAGSMVPRLWGDAAVVSVASALWAMIGGFVGIWLAVWLNRRVDW